MTSTLINWVRANPAQAQQLEQLSMTAVYLICDPNSIVSMEGGFSFVRLLSTVNARIIASAEKFGLDEKLEFASQLLGDTQCFLELLARKLRSRDVAWRVAALIALVRSLLSLALKRKALLKLWQLRHFASPSSPPTAALSPPESGYSKLTIPRVVLSENRGQRPAATLQDYLVFIVELFFSLRPLLWVLLPWRTWKSWRIMAAAEVAACALSYAAQRGRAPVIADASLEDDVASLEESNRSSARFANLAYLLARDPFFSIALKQSIKNKLVNGCINKVPLLGGLVAAQTQYCLTMQESSVLYSLGSFSL